MVSIAPLKAQPQGSNSFPAQLPKVRQFPRVGSQAFNISAGVGDGLVSQVVAAGAGGHSAGPQQQCQSSVWWCTPGHSVLGVGDPQILGVPWLASPAAGAFRKYSRSKPHQIWKGHFRPSITNTLRSFLPLNPFTKGDHNLLTAPLWTEVLLKAELTYFFKLP